MPRRTGAEQTEASKGVKLDFHRPNKTQGSKRERHKKEFNPHGDAEQTEVSKGVKLDFH